MVFSLGNEPKVVFCFQTIPYPHKNPVAKQNENSNG